MCVCARALVCVCAVCVCVCARARALCLPVCLSVCLSFCLFVNISPQGLPFGMKILPSYNQRAKKVKIVVAFSLKLLRCKDRALPWAIFPADIIIITRMNSVHT